MFLTESNLETLTDRKRPTAQIRWLAEHGYHFEISASGRPKVLKANVEARLSDQEFTPTESPNFATLRKGA